MELTQELVREWFDYVDGFLYWKIQRRGRSRIGTKAGFLHKNEGRYWIGIKGKIYYRSQIVFLWHKGYIPKEIDHKNRDKTNDRIENLRPCTRSQNAKNRTKKQNTASKYIGVHKHHDKKRWVAHINLSGSQKHLGVFNSETEAASSYNKMAAIHHGEFANLNVIESK